MSKEDYHGKGEQDARDDKYEQPHGFFDELTTWSVDGMEKIKTDNEQYDKGYHHGRGQQDASNDEYNPPHGFIDELTTWSQSKQEEHNRQNDAYDSGHDSTSEQKDSGGCYLTTACTEAAGLPDDCQELTVLRGFRDRYLAEQPGGPALIREYYQTAPSIVKKIHASARRHEILNEILTDVRAAVSFVRQGHLGSALTRYREMFERLNREFGKT